MKTRDIVWIILVSTGIVIVLDMLTNAIDTKKYAWDFLYYIAMAKDGFNAQPMASPFAYRYLTPFIVNGITRISSLSIENGFLVIAYLGAIAQLTGIFFFTNWLTRSRKGAYLAMMVTALSLFNVKFLLFDVYRPDHLAYALILLQTYFAFEKKFLPLLITTIIASQIREFNIIPLIAYLIASWYSEERSIVFNQIFFSVIFLFPAIILPRLLIPVTENYQIVGLSQGGIITALLLPLVPTVDINYVFSILAYFLPLLFIADLKTIKETLSHLPDDQRRYLYAYTVLVLILSFFGGTDFYRFATFLFLPQVILIGFIAPQKSNFQIGAMLAVMFIFNRIWLPFPIWDKDQYLDFYGAFALRLNWSTLYRILECLAFISLGILLRMKNKKAIPLILFTMMGLACNFTVNLTSTPQQIPTQATFGSPVTEFAPTQTQPSASESGIPASDIPLTGTYIAKCPMFPVDNFWNMPIDSLPIHPESDKWINSIGSAESFHMDFGSGTWDGGPIGIPFNIVAGSTVQKYRIEFYYPDESDSGPYPLPENPIREWGSDHHILVVDTDTCILYEVYDANFEKGQWSGGSGAIWDLNSNALRPLTWTSADAAGLPILPGLVRYDEIRAGKINHALRFTAEKSAGYIWPARHPNEDLQAGTPPMGARFRLKVDYDISSFPHEMQVILQAMKTYGIVLADNGSNWYISGAPDERWDNDMLHQLDVLTGNDFEAVDTSEMMVDMNSGKAK